MKISPGVSETPTLPPNLRHLLSQPETPAPKPRWRNNQLDGNRRQSPAGPAPPNSWVLGNKCCSVKGRGKDQEKRNCPTHISHLPGLVHENRNGLRELCLRSMARDWDFIQLYEMHNLASLPTWLRISFLSYVAVYGPEGGVGFIGLKNIAVFPQLENMASIKPDIHNEKFFRLDLSGAMGHSISFKQLTKLIHSQLPPISMETPDLTWEDNFALSASLSPPLPYLTHLSLSHPSHDISWPRLLAFINHLPTLTHLSLAYWPVPSTTPNSKTALMVSKNGRISQYGAANFYSHTLDFDFSEAMGILRRFADKVPGLEYFDLTGSQAWFEALVGEEEDDHEPGIEWGKQWSQLQTLKLQSGIELCPKSTPWQVLDKKNACEKASKIEHRIIKKLRVARTRGSIFKWIQIIKDE